MWDLWHKGWPEGEPQAPGIFHHRHRQHQKSRPGEQGDELPRTWRWRGQPACDVAPLRGQPNHPSVPGGLLGQAHRLQHGRSPRLDLKGTGGHGRHGHKAIYLRNAAKGPPGHRGHNAVPPGTGRVSPGAGYDPADLWVGVRLAPGGHRRLDRKGQPPGGKAGSPVVVAYDQARPKSRNLIGAHYVRRWGYPCHGPGRVRGKGPAPHSQHRPDKTWNVPARQAIGRSMTGYGVHTSIVAQTGRDASGREVRAKQYLDLTALPWYAILFAD